MYRTSNPAIKNMGNYCNGADLVSRENTASYKGVAMKALWFIGVAIISAVISSVILFRDPTLSAALLVVSLIGAVVCSLVAAFMPATSAVSGTLYCLFEGFSVGAVSAIIDLAYSGVVLAALMSTFVTFAIMVVLYATGVIKVTNRFRSFMISALLGICITQLLMLILGFIFPTINTLFYGNGFIGVLVAAAMVVFAAFFILVDLSDITMLVDSGMAKQYEWRAAYGLSVTLIWLYLEFLRLIMLIASRNRD